MASAASVVIIANAVFLQSGSHPAPFFANPATQPQVADSRFTVAVLPPPRPADALSIHPPVSPRAAQQAGARRNDPIADLIGSAIGTPARVMAVQRVLSEFGYGQIKQTGVVDEATSAAIEKFETDRRLPVTGRISARLFTELAVMTGRPVE